MHRLEYTLITLHHCLYSTSTLHNIALHNTNQTIVCIRIHKNLQIHLLAEMIISQCHNSLYDNDFARLNMNSFLLTRRGDIVIDWLLYSMTLLQLLNMLRKQWPLKRIRVIEIDVLALLRRHITTILVIGILRNNHYFAFRKALYQFFDYRCFTRASTARYANDKHGTK